ncbi:MAG: 16S rRNA (cytosine(1402)-N(4))-methyltransferase RsmH [Atopobiaceae bacterium]|jgi:16S rRNA (cytosine1402-N4)-methyltransferase
MSSEFKHIPVMLDEVLRFLDPKRGETVCDCTLGGAGHSVELAKRVAPEGLSLGIDQDERALAAARERMEREVPTARYHFMKGNFSNLDDLLVQAEVPGVDCFLFDLGVSSPQLDVASRGFSYNEDAPLDMRMNPEDTAISAADVVNTYSEEDLARILKLYGDESHARGIARQIVRSREKRPIETTLELVDVIKRAIPARDRRHGHHPARKSFQALRIEVNHELDALDKGLRSAIRWANTGGRICVISYHSLEDRITKHVFSELSQGCICPPELPVCVCGHIPIVRVMTKKPITASTQECEHNPRARSALIRVAQKLDVTHS